MHTHSYHDTWQIAFCHLVQLSLCTCTCYLKVTFTSGLIHLKQVATTSSYSIYINIILLPLEPLVRNSLLTNLEGPDIGALYDITTGKIKLLKK